MSKKGFTLIELLAVLVLLSIIVLVAFPNILGTIKNTDKQLNEAAIVLLESNTRSYITDQPEKFPISGKKTSYCVSVKELVEEGYTKSPIANLSQDEAKSIEENWSVSFVYENGKIDELKVQTVGCK